jgi:2-succinyl-6-hydroxy-2,4-cyclohexadiene-1-carboxylate synthase
MDRNAGKFQIISHDGTNIAAYDHGGEGEPIVFLHCLSGIAQQWDPLIKHFITNYRVLTYDLRGHGKSDQPAENYAFEDMAKDLDAVLDHFKINKTHLVGSSYGCMIGLYYASTRTECVLSLVNCDGAVLNDTGENGLSDETLEEHLAKYRDQLDPDYESVEAYKQFYRENWEPWNEYKAYYLEQYEPRIKENGKAGPRTTGYTMEKIISEIYYVDFLKWYEKVKCPVLFLPSSEGHLDKSMRFIEKAAVGLPYSQTVVIPESKHLMMFEQEDELAEAIRNFYNSIPISMHSPK